MKIARLFKELALSVVSAGTTLIIAACYGTYDSYEDDWTTILAQGKLTNEAGDAVQGLQVCAEIDTSERCSPSDVLGDYSISVEQAFYDSARENGFILTVEDTDGETNGEYENASITVTPEEVEQGSREIDVVVEAVEETEETDGE